MLAEALLQQFAVYGRFYEKAIAGVPEKLRDRLEIAPHAWPVADCVNREPDLIVIMMNPGASRPLDALWDGRDHAGFVATQPDRTQYQIMRLMLAAREHGLAWNHARVLNLSDLRTPRSAVFMEKLAAYAGDDSHSLFSAVRQDECKALLAQSSTPVLCAWGLSPHFHPLAARALQAAGHHVRLGLSDDGISYRHPLPQRHDFQVKWVADMTEQLINCRSFREIFEK